MTALLTQPELAETQPVDAAPPLELVERDGNLVDSASGEIIERQGVRKTFEVKDLSDAAWVLRKRARDLKRLDDLNAAMNREIQEETDRIRAAYSKQIETAAQAAGWWSQNRIM